MFVLAAVSLQQLGVMAIITAAVGGFWRHITNSDKHPDSDKVMYRDTCNERHGAARTLDNERYEQVNRNFDKVNTRLDKVDTNIDKLREDIQQIRNK